MNMSKQLKSFVAIAAAAAGLMGAGAASAQSVAAVSAPDNWTFSAAGLNVVPGMITPLVTKQANLRLVVFFSAECAAVAPAGNTSAWLDVDIQMLDALGNLVMTLPPTIGSADAFCSANGTAGTDGWNNQTIIARVPFDVPAGNYRFRVAARLNAGATSGWLGERALVVSR